MEKMTEPLLNNYTQGPLANVIVFHGFEAPPDVLKAWVDEAQIFFREHQMEPIWGGVGGENGYKTSKWVKAKSVFQRLRTRHESRNRVE
jgi:hypothetical protein